jgi:glycosyltransferase involved in cell wall biosynthesis
VHVQPVAATGNGADAHPECCGAHRVAAEIVVVDNNSRDDTKLVVSRAARASAIPVRYVFERAGMSFARNRGLREATGSIVAFTDDDCVVDSGWIGALCDEFAADPGVAIIGSRVDLYSPEDQRVSIRPIAERVRYTDATQVYGLGWAATSRFGAVAERIGGFDPAFGGSKGRRGRHRLVYRAFEQRLGTFTPPRECCTITAAEP